jgi:hypothetical protein
MLSDLFNMLSFVNLNHMCTNLSSYINLSILHKFLDQHAPTYKIVVLN